jgi:predicted amidohydrolase
MLGELPELPQQHMNWKHSATIMVVCASRVTTVSGLRGAPGIRNSRHIKGIRLMINTRQSFVWPAVAVVVVYFAGYAPTSRAADDSSVVPSATSGNSDLVRVAAVQAKPRLIDWRLRDLRQVLEAVDENLIELESIVDRAGDMGCDILAFPEDTLGLLNWFGMNEQLAPEVLPEAVRRMIERLGRAAAAHEMHLVLCSDCLEADGGIYNTAFFLDRTGKEIGRYHKTCPTWSESASRKRGQSFPVFETSALGTVGMLICYDLVFPETARCLALAGADIIFFPTMGGAAIGEGDIGVQALRVRAAENHVYLVVAFRGSGSMIISPRGEILARAEGPDGIVFADIDPRGGRQGGDAMNYQSDMRARLFRERNPAAFGMLTEPDPPILERVPIDIKQREAGRIASEVLTIGEEEFRQAEELVRAGNTTEAISAFRRLRSKYRGSWIDRVAAERLKTFGDN